MGQTYAAVDALVLRGGSGAAVLQPVIARLPLRASLNSLAFVHRSACSFSIRAHYRTVHVRRNSWARDADVARALGQKARHDLLR